MTALKYNEASDSHTYRITMNVTATMQTLQVCCFGDSNVFSVCYW